jgi:hypothetical protein
MKEPEIALAFTAINTGYSQYEIKVDELKAKQIGVCERFDDGSAGLFDRMRYTPVCKHYRLISQVLAKDHPDVNVVW